VAPFIHGIPVANLATFGEVELSLAPLEIHAITAIADVPLDTSKGTGAAPTVHIRSETTTATAENFIMSGITRLAVGGRRGKFKDNH